MVDRADPKDSPSAALPRPVTKLTFGSIPIKLIGENLRRHATKGSPDADCHGKTVKVLRLFSIILFSMAVAAPAIAQVAPPVTLPPQAPVVTLEAPADALARDADEYARQFAVSPDEAQHRLAAQEDSVPATDALAEEFRDRLTGIVIEHRPVWRIVVVLAGETPVAERTIFAGGMTVPVIFRSGARATREQVVWAMTWHQPAIRALLRRPPGMGLDPRTGELVVTLGAADAAAAGGADALRDRIAAIAHVPVRISVIERIDRDLDLAGGARIEGVEPGDGKRYRCTTGFAVSDGTRHGLTTAAHCADAMTYSDPRGGTVPLDFLGQWGWGYQDVQIGLSATPPAPTLYDDTAKTLERPVLAQRSRAATRAGDFVCHRGERTGYSCSLVQLTDFAPAGDLCGGACLPTWVAVAGPKCQGGDSGAPVFLGGTAFGMVKGGSYRPDGSCAFYFYMSLDYLPPGWTLLRAASPGVSISTSHSGGAATPAASRSSARAP
jgi:streptogrisin C